MIHNTYSEYDKERRSACGLRQWAKRLACTIDEVPVLLYGPVWSKVKSGSHEIMTRK